MQNLDKTKIKEVIEKYEMRQTRAYRLSQNWVTALNIKVKKDEVLADVIMHHEDGFDRFNGVKDPKTMFKEAI